MRLYFLILVLLIVGCSSGDDNELFETPEMMEKGIEEMEPTAVVGQLIEAFV